MHRFKSSATLRAAAIALALAFAAPATASAAPSKTKAAKSAKAKFYNMSESLFDGRRMAPATSMFSTEPPPRFGRLLTLRKPNFLKGTFESAKMSVFR